MINDILKKKMLRIPTFVWILFVIILVGTFLRTYQLHDWLHFGSDQARDEIIIEKAVTGETAWPLLGAEASNTRFKLGPMHYHFRIIAEKIFGTSEEVSVYPDVFFSLLAIPLFFLFVKRYFRTYLSLLLTGLFAVSFYIVEYSRFAWNPNPIPFFVLLLFYSLLELLLAKEKTRWWWILSIGVVLGIGIQLHTILLILFPALLFLCLVFSVFNKWFVWKQWMIIFVIALFCNVAQIQSEIQKNGANTKLFIQSFTDRSQSGGSRFFESLQLDILCHGQASGHMVSSLGERGKCNYDAIFKRMQKSSHMIRDFGLTFVGIVVSMFFFVGSCFLLAYRFWKEQEREKKYFLGLIGMYLALSFVVLFSVIRGAPLRYFIQEAIIPFIFLGLLVDEYMKKYTRKWALWVVGIVFAVLIGMNLSTIFGEARNLSDGTRGDSGFVVLGEAENMIAYIIEHSDTKEIYLSGSTQYLLTYYKTLLYLGAKNDVRIIKVKTKNVAPSGSIVFFVAQKLKPGTSFERGDAYTLEEYENFGNGAIYKLHAN